jgi:molybdate transport system ATP-binding protein
MAVEIKTKHVLTVAIRKQFAGDGGFALDVEFSMPAGISILFGPSGAGKTTILDCIAGLTVPDSGRITVPDRTFFDNCAEVSLSPQARSTGYVFQDLALFPHLTVEGNIQYGLAKLDPADRQTRTNTILESFMI